MQPNRIANNLIKQFDTDDNGSMSFCEFKSMLRDYLDGSEIDKEKILKNEFKELDKNGDNSIDICGEII
jgi:Ca2+-binding EF-hand superfamily protein